MRRIRTVDLAAIGFVVAAGLIAVLWLAAGTPGTWIDQWLPNLAVEALSIAATILIVDRIVAHEAHERLRPRLDAAYGEIVGALASFLGDLAKTEADPDFDALVPPLIPRGRFDRFVDKWLGGPPRRGLPRRKVTVDPSVLHGMTSLLAGRMAPVADRERDILPPDLVTAIDRLGREVERTQAYIGRLEKDEQRPPTMFPREREARAAEALAKETLGLVDALRAVAPVQWREVESRVMVHRAMYGGPPRRGPLPSSNRPAGPAPRG